MGAAPQARGHQQPLTITIPSHLHVRLPLALPVFLFSAWPADGRVVMVWKTDRRKRPGVLLPRRRSCVA